MWRYILIKEKKCKKLFFQSLDPALAYGTIFTRIIIRVLQLLLNCCYRTNLEAVGLLGRVEAYCQFENVTSRMKKGDIIFSRKGNIFLLAWIDKSFVWMISTIHDTPVSVLMTTGGKNRKMGENSLPASRNIMPTWKALTFHVVLF